MTMSTKRDSASINSGDDPKRQKMNTETEMKELVRNSMLPSIVVYLPPRDILNCIQTNKKWKEEIDTEYVWNDLLLPSMMLYHCPRDISKCIQASKKWKDKIDTVDTFWRQVVNSTVSPTIVKAIEEHASKLFSSSSGVTNTINYKSIALAFGFYNKFVVTKVRERLDMFYPDVLVFDVKNSQTQIIVLIRKGPSKCRLIAKIFKQFNWKTNTIDIPTKFDMNH